MCNALSMMQLIQLRNKHNQKILYSHAVNEGDFKGAPFCLIFLTGLER